MSAAVHSPSESPWQGAWRRFSSQRTTLAAVAGLGLIIVLCVAGPWFSPYTETAQNLKMGATAPSWQHWLGTDSLGRDLATRVLFGGRISLLVGLLATLVAAVIGVIYGMAAGLLGGRTDASMMRLVDILYAFPFMTFVILLTAMYGKSLVLVFVAIGAVEWLTMARVVRGQVLVLTKQEFITAARGFGTGFGTILWKHLLPNVTGIVVIYGSLTVPGVMMFEATLSFLGLGIQPPNSSWGVLISEGAAAIQASPWLLLGPSALVCATLLALNTIGDSLRDALDPKSMA